MYVVRRLYLIPNRNHFASPKSLQLDTVAVKNTNRRLVTPLSHNVVQARPENSLPPTGLSYSRRMVQLARLATAGKLIK